MNKSYKFQSLESLRAYMAWWVVLGHALQLSGFWTIAELKDYFSGSSVYLKPFIKLMELLLHGGSAVNVFIILSGFVITHLLLVKHEPYWAFITRRFFRLAPALYVCIMLALCFVDFYQIAYTGLSFSGDVTMRQTRLLEQENHFFLHLFNHLTLFHSFFPHEIIPYSATTFLAPAWSIGLEWQFYLIAPFLLTYLKQSQRTVIVVIFFLFAIRFIIHHLSGFHWQYNSFFFKVPDYFLVGILSRLIIDRLSNKQGIADISIIMVALLIIQDRYSTFVWLLMLGIIFYEMGQLNIESRILKKIIDLLFFSNVAKNLGKWSYSTYLVHIPIFSLAVGGYVSYTGNYEVTRMDAILILLLSMPFIVLISNLMFKLVEQPAMNFISLKLKNKN